MRKHGWIFFLLTVVVVLMLFYTVAYTVSYRETTIVTTFGDAGDAIYGKENAGLHWKWPWPVQRLVRYDARKFVFEDTYNEILTNDKQNILVSVFCVWRIKDANIFIDTFKGRTKEKDCEERLRTRLLNAKGNVISSHPLAHLINTDSGEMQITVIEKEMLDKISQSAMTDYGVEIVTVGIKSLGLPPNVTKEVIKNMQAERKTQADAYRASGKAVADTIRERAKTARDQILAFTTNKAEGIKAEGDKAAAEYYKKFRENEEFAMFLREMKFLVNTLRQNSEIVLDAGMLRGIGYFKDGAPDIPVKKNDSKKAW
ncbi:MAG: SPFH domain-containing protein [Phycisphaerae bacterium]|nr:SPFH domain-containing protein [Phycisphaerae bacterium]